MDKRNFEDLKEPTVETVECCDVCGKRVAAALDGRADVNLVSEESCSCRRVESKIGENSQSSSNAPQPSSTDHVDVQAVRSSAANHAEFPDLGDRYEVLNKVGQGGMGAVYKVKDKALDKEFAVKVMNSNLVQDKVSVKRFEQEAQAASSLTHANLAAVYGFGVSKAGSPYLVMDYLDGQTLEQTLKQEGFLDVSRALDIFIQAAEAIADAHMKGVIHRDIKPSNIILEKREGIDFVKIVDFGIAKVLPSQQKAYENLTQTGDIFGSPLYMSPEQCQGNMQDRRSDIYSLGCVMYEALTGVQPYAAENPIKIILKHIHEDPQPINTLKNDYKIPADLDKAILHCLEREPDDRYQSTDELVRDLRKIRDGFKIQIKAARKKPEPTGPMPAGSRRSQGMQDISLRRRRLIVLGFCAATMGILAALSIFRSGSVVLNSYSDAQDFDSKSYAYYINGEYEKAAPLLEFGVPTYKEHIAKALALGDKQAVLRDQTALAENWQHIGKCHFMMVKKAAAAGDKVTETEELGKALHAYQQAMPFYFEHGNWPGGSTPEAVQGYANVLRALGMTKELNQLMSFASKCNISI